MKVAPMPVNEKERLAELYRHELLDTPYEKDFNDIVQLASQICQVPVSAISLIDSGRQWFKAKVGIEYPEGPRSESFCGHAILEDHLFEIPDALQDERFADNPAVTGTIGIRFYAGMPLVTEKGYKLGTLCVGDTVPRHLSEEQQYTLKVLGSQVMRLFELRIRNNELQNLIRTQERIISIVSHDVRNPLASLKSILELRQQDMVSQQEADELMAMSARQMESTIDMVNNVVEWGRLQMKREHLKQEINIHELVKKVFAGYELTTSLKHNQLVNATNEQVFVWYDAQALQFILRNLVNNAIKFTENGTITVSTETSPEGSTCIKVCDTGVGIDQDRISTMFDTHKNFSTPGTQNEKGSGLGLILIKEFMNKVKGAMHITSQLGRGTCVSICL
ncbi:GAF domain-containing sensor histidine kinase [Deminuibacter soli]|uniref:histidine kinase n=1 Tax=Deminuibacter soli TaxID=2291815 RepID=A0A3E1NQT2_9BACT|nr:GAF domain-containing sensor histidine kinase [Deminuibacter soli]RFM30283.1 GAF domain-containing protein [Deminuibacter soli]